MRELAPGHGNRRVPSSPSQTVSLLLSLWSSSRAVSAPSLGVITATATGRARQAAPGSLRWKWEGTRWGKAPARRSSGACQEVDSTTTLSSRDGAGLSTPK